MRTWLGQYILIGRLPVPCHDLIRWAEWMETADRRVAQTMVGPLRVSTVFLGLDHNFREGDPLLFETMVFGADQASAYGESYCDRYTTWDEAEQGHAKAVAWAEDRLADADAFLRDRKP